jgi:hypothetical protein
MSSIFGDVSQGVPNPVVAHAHPYPTRYHGMNLVQPQATFSYREAPYVVSNSPPMAMRGSPDGIGSPFSFDDPSFLTGSSAVDLLIGAGIGFVSAPPGKWRVLMAVIGAGATYGSGISGIVPSFVGMIGVGAIGGLMRVLGNRG